MGCGAVQGPSLVYVFERDVDPADTGRSPARPAAHQCQSIDPHVFVKLLRDSGMQACRRLGVELEQLLRGEEGRSSHSGLAIEGVEAAPRSTDTLLEWDARLHGPTETPYAGGIFLLAMWFPESYPFGPPRTEFITPCYHPNISERGNICLNVLKADWSPMLTISSVLLCISALLSQPNPDDPLNSVAAEALKRCPREFERTAREWTRRYAMRGRPSPAVRARGSRNTSDLSVDPLATYQTTADGRTLDEDEALETVLRESHSAVSTERAPKHRHHAHAASTSTS